MSPFGLLRGLLAVQGFLEFLAMADLIAIGYPDEATAEAAASESGVLSFLSRSWDTRQLSCPRAPDSSPCPG